MVKNYKDEFKDQLSKAVLHSIEYGNRLEFDIDEFNYNYDKGLVDDYIQAQKESSITKNELGIDRDYLTGALRYTKSGDLSHYTVTLLEELFNRRYNVLLSADFPDISKDDPYLDAVRDADFHRFRKDPVVQDFIMMLIKAVDTTVLSLYDDTHGSGASRQYIQTIYGDEGDGLGITIEQQSLF